MTQEIIIIPTTVEHIRQLIADLRDDDRREIEKWDVSPFKGIWRNYKGSKDCRSLFIGDRIMAIGGINGSVLGFVGKPWLMTSNAVNNYPLVFAVIYRREVHKWLKSYRFLETFVDSCYAKSIQMMRIIGFKEREFVPTKNGLLLRMEIEAPNV
jgi:hypothetical protein